MFQINMPYTNINGANLWSTDTGGGEQTILFVHGLLMSGEMFKEQVEALAKRYRCITLDLRGQGRSEISETGYDIDSLTGDVVALIQQLDCAPCHFVGLSMGGFIGIRLAIHHPDLLISLALLDTSADPEPAGKARQYRILAWIVRWFGVKPVIGRIMKILFGRSFLKNPVQHDLRVLWRNRLMANSHLGLSRAAAGVIDREGVYEHLGRIECPTVVIVGDEDVATPPDRSRRMHGAISGSRLVTIARAGHSPTIEQPGAVTRALQDFYATVKLSA